MKMLVIVTDSEYVPHCMNMMREKGMAGYTVIPEAFGMGRSGAKMGDRLHPGASTVIFTVVQDETAPTAVECIRECIAENRLCESTHAWVIPVEAALHEMARQSLPVGE